MKKLNKKGFTMVELIIVIVIIGVLAAVLIPTFGGIIRKANDSAYQQDRINQMIQDEIEKIDKGKDNYLSWKDLEEAIANALNDQNSGGLANKIIAIIKGNDKETGLTNEQLTAILEAIANKKLSDIQVRIILEGIKDIKDDEDDEKPVLTEQQIAAILAKLPQVGITKEDITAAVNAVLGNGSDLAKQINAAVAAAVGKATLTAEEITAIIDQIIESNLKAIGDYVARIGGKGYETLAAAITAAENGDTIVMLKNHTTAAQTFSKTLTLDLNGKAISGTGQLLTFNGTGSFTVKDSSINGSITGAQVAVKNSGTGTVVIDGGSLIVPDNKQHYGIYNTAAGTIIVNKGLVSGQCGIYNSALGATIRVNGGEIRGGSKSGIFCLLGKGDVIITGGTVTSTSEYGISFSTNSSYNSTGQGSLTVSGNASISGTYGIFSGNPSIITLSGNTTVTGSGNYGIYLYNTSTTPASITINDSAKISGNSKYGVYVSTNKAVNTLNINNNSEIKGLTGGVYDYNGVVNIDGGTISGGTYGVVNTGTLTIEDGTIQANLYYGVSNSGTLNMNGGTIIGGIHESAGRGIYNTGTTTINGGTISMNAQTANQQVAIDNRKTLTINGGNVTSNVIGVYNTDSFTQTGGTINGGTQAVQTIGTTTINGGEIRCDNGTGINVAGGNLTLANGNIYSGVNGIIGTTDNKANLTINGGSISAPNGFALVLYHKDAIITNGTLSGANAIVSDTSDSTCTISGGTFNATGSQVCYAYEGFFTISGGKFTGSGSTNVEDHIYRYTLNCFDSSYNANPATAGFTVKGGSFYQFNPVNDLSEGANTCFTPEGYHAEYDEETGYYTVVENN